jgi:hypothetical protein
MEYSNHALADHYLRLQHERTDHLFGAFCCSGRSLFASREDVSDSSSGYQLEYQGEKFLEAACSDLSWLVLVSLPPAKGVTKIVTSKTFDGCRSLKGYHPNQL